MKNSEKQNSERHSSIYKLNDALNIIKICIITTLLYWCDNQNFSITKEKEIIYIPQQAQFEIYEAQKWDKMESIFKKYKKYFHNIGVSYNDFIADNSHLKDHKNVKQGDEIKIRTWLINPKDVEEIFKEKKKFEKIKKMFEKKSIIQREYIFENMQTKLSIPSDMYLENKLSWLNHTPYIKTHITSLIENSEEILNSIIKLFKFNVGSKEKNAQRIIHFVNLLNYISDQDWIDYPKSPIETLVEWGWDCEDLSILAYWLLKYSWIETILVELNCKNNSHIVVGILWDYKWWHVEKDSKRYYLAESTWTLSFFKPTKNSIWDYKNSTIEIECLNTKKWISIISD